MIFANHAKYSYSSRADVVEQGKETATLTP